MKLFLSAAAAIATCLIPVRAEVPLGSFAGSGVGFEGLFQVDGYRFHNDLADLDGRPDGRDRASGIRRLELVLKGDGPGGLSWTAGYDAEGESWLDANLAWSFGGNGAGHRLLVGQSKQALGLEELSSTRNNDFIAKAAATGAFAPGRRLGVSWALDGGSHGASLGWFGRDLDDEDAGAGYALRGWWAPVHGEDRVLHLGLAHLDRDTTDDQARLRARPNADMAAVRLVDSGLLTDVDRVATTGLELMWISGPLKLQGEYFLARHDRNGGGAYDAEGGYASLLWTPGGEGWGYRGGLPRTRPGDAGSWQFGLRYDLLDLDDDAVRGGRMEAWTLGASRYIGRHARLSLNHVHVSSRRGGPAPGDDPSILAARLQLHW